MWSAGMGTDRHQPIGLLCCRGEGHPGTLSSVLKEGGDQVIVNFSKIFSSWAREFHSAVMRTFSIAYTPCSETISAPFWLESSFVAPQSVHKALLVSIYNVCANGHLWPAW